ncbi:hypothetical protein ACLOJK_020857 [Asimina triloba]
MVVTACPSSSKKRPPNPCPSSSKKRPPNPCPSATHPPTLHSSTAERQQLFLFFPAIKHYLRMLFLVLLRFLLPIALMVFVWLAYFFSLCYLWKHRVLHAPPAAAQGKGKAKNGLSESELQQLPTTEDIARGTECAVCLDDIEKGQVARVLPACSHAFHLQCADAWLSTRAVCPVCRIGLAKPPDSSRNHELAQE